MDELEQHVKSLIRLLASSADEDEKAVREFALQVAALHDRIDKMKKKGSTPEEIRAQCEADVVRLVSELRDFHRRYNEEDK